MEEGRGRLTITVKNALQLPVVKHYSHLLKKLAPKMNPYVVLKLGSEVHQTRVDEGGHRAPVWNDTVTFELMPGLGDLEIKVMHKGNLTGKDSEIASGSIPSHQLRHFVGQDYRINVVGPGEVTNSGLIAISARYEEGRRPDKLLAPQFHRHRSSSVESGSSRQTLANERLSQGSIGHALPLSQGISLEAPAWLSGSRQPSLQNPLQHTGYAKPGEEEMSTSTPVGSHKSKKYLWGIGNIIAGHSKRERLDDQLGQLQPADHEAPGMSGRPSDQEAFQSRPYREQVVPVRQDQSTADTSPQYDRSPELSMALPSSSLDGELRVEPPETDGGAGHNQMLAQPEQVHQQADSRRQSGLRLRPAEEGPVRTKTQWLDQWEQGHAAGARRVTESSLPDQREPTFSEPSRRRMTETHEAPSAPLMEVSPQNSQREGAVPQRAHMRGGREVKEWHEFDGPAPPHYQLPSYLQAMGVDRDRDDISWNMTARGDHSHFSQRERETEWERQNSDIPYERLQASSAEAPALEDQIQAMRVTRNAAQDSVSNPFASSVTPGHPFQAGTEPSTNASTLQYPEPDYEGPASSSLSDRFGGFSQASDRPFFENLVPQEELLPNGQVDATTPSGPYTANADLTSIPPMYVSPFEQEGPGTLLANQAVQVENSVPDPSFPRTAQPATAVHTTAQMQAARGKAVPFTDIKGQLDGKRSEESVSGSGDLSKAMTSLQSDLTDDGWRIDESELSLALDSKGKPAQLGKGSFGEVYKGWHNYSPVAIKVLQVDSPRALKDALDEMKVLTKIHSNHIVRLLGYTITEEVNPETQATMVKKVNLVTELLDGNLWEALSKGKFTWHMGGNKIIWEVCTGMYQMHRQHIRHLDLKSPNILLTDNGHAKIADFGMASVVGINNIQSTIKGMGTYAWASPEMLLGKPITDKADVFSLGVILWEICTGEKPQRGLLRALEPDEAPEEINQLINACIQEDTEERPTMHEFLKVLLRYVPFE